MSEFKWAISGEELRQAKEVIGKSLPIMPHLQSANGMQEVHTDRFTHKCCCPNPAHKGGTERTPSFYFSETENTFYCFGCQIFGNTLDLESILSGVHWTVLVEERMKDSVWQNAAILPKKLDQRRLAFEQNLAFAAAVRDWISLLPQTKQQQALLWADSLYEKIDGKLEDLDQLTAEQVKSFFIQCDIDLHRKKKEYETRNNW